MNEKFKMAVAYLCEGIEDDAMKEKICYAFQNAITDACFSTARSVSVLNNSNYLQTTQGLVNYLMY